MPCTMFQCFKRSCGDAMSHTRNSFQQLQAIGNRAFVPCCLQHWAPGQDRNATVTDAPTAHLSLMPGLARLSCLYTPLFRTLL
jgi:hypothetical protein